MIIDRNDYCIPFTEVLKYHNEGFELKSLYEIVLVNRATGSLETVILADKNSIGTALSYARGYFHDTEYEAIDAYPIMIHPVEFS